jgi:hypothetical protein
MHSAENLRCLSFHLSIPIRDNDCLPTGIGYSKTGLGLRIE